MKTDEKIIKDFKKYIEVRYFDYINQEVIKEYMIEKDYLKKNIKY